MQMRNLQRSTSGSALVLSLLVVVALAGVAAAVFALSLSQNKEVAADGSEARALYLAEAGVSEAMLQLSAAVKDGEPIPASVGSLANPFPMKDGAFFADLVDNGDETYTITARGMADDAARTIQAVVTEIGGGAFDHAIFAGNSSGDPAYELRVSGTGASADEVLGDVYSGGHVRVDDDATITGDAVASGTVTGMAGDEGETRPLPDIAGMNYPVNNDFDVAAMFAAGATQHGNALGGTAWELPESSPAHIFRKNPSDRTTETSGTAKDDYFLEDPYQAVTDFTAWNGTLGHTISLSGTMGEPGPSGTDKVYYIDGNLWVHNKPFGRLRLMNTDAAGVKVTFVVRGNVYFSDDVLLEDPDNDGVAFIAIKDPAETDSGNIYLGDPRYGTLERMYAFLYAENNFYDNNLSADGSSTVELFGNMTAGNHVAIERDFVKGDGSIVHSKLMVDFDDRISSGALVLPGIPRLTIEGVNGMQIVLWHEIAEN